MIILYMASSPDIILHHITNTNTTVVQISPLDESTKEGRDQGSVFPSLRQVIQGAGSARVCPDVLPAMAPIFGHPPGPDLHHGPGPYSMPVSTSHNITIIYRKHASAVLPK